MPFHRYIRDPKETCVWMEAFYAGGGGRWTLYIPEYEREYFPFTNHGGFPERQDTITVINLVKLLKSDLLFKLIMGGWGGSMSLIEIWRQ